MHVIELHSCVFYGGSRTFLPEFMYISFRVEYPKCIYIYLLVDYRLFYQRKGTKNVIKNYMDGGHPILNYLSDVVHNHVLLMLRDV